jgi:hypothetical protein
MSLSREARGLVDAGRRETGGPSEEQRKRMRRAVMVAVGTSAVGAATTSTAAAAATSSGLGVVAKMGIGAMVVAFVGGGVALVSQREEAPAPPAAVTAQIATQAATAVASAPSKAMAVETAVDPEPAASVITASASTVVRAPTAASTDASDDLAEEVRLLKTARSQLGSGSAGEALASLESYAARFPKGKLAPEARALRAMALCKSGRADEGRAIATAISESAPGSPISERVLEACK